MSLTRRAGKAYAAAFHYYEIIRRQALVTFLSPPLPSNYYLKHFWPAKKSFSRHQPSSSNVDTQKIRNFMMMFVFMYQSNFYVGIVKCCAHLFFFSFR